MWDKELNRQLHRSARFCCWTEGHFRSDFLRRIWIRAPKSPKGSWFEDLRIEGFRFKDLGFKGLGVFIASHLYDYSH